ncbi:hypothetical protein [Phenylobacterium sp. J367]|uniref:hypothetical protein n=1 Tax=Phenylobacterium sp. J367 TaxID=2898435 RepID=UPI002150F91A|nr:hypothetical protein [Phenylobacterium sp. J367]MCR5879917.1 hypothetical protein [Phenylobacterium sp. J367]
MQPEGHGIVHLNVSGQGTIMNQFSASEAALEGFRLIRSRPGTMLAWAGVYFLGMMAIGLLMGIALGPRFADAMRGGNTTEKTEAVAGILAQSWPAFLLVLLVVATLESVLIAGIYRLTLRPNEPGFAHLRLGRDEFRLTAVNMVLYPIGFLCLAGGVLAWESMLDGSLLSGLLLVAILVLTAWLGARLSLVTPTTFATHRIAFRDGWRLTRGRTAPLLFMMVLAAIFYVMIWLGITLLSFFIVWVSNAASLDAGSVTPTAIAVGLATLVMQFLLFVLRDVMIYAPFGEAYLQLAPGAAEAAGAAA